MPGQVRGPGGGAEGWGRGPDVREVGPGRAGAGPDPGSTGRGWEAELGPDGSASGAGPEPDSGAKPGAERAGPELAENRAACRGGAENAVGRGEGGAERGPFLPACERWSGLEHAQRGGAPPDSRSAQPRWPPMQPGPCSASRPPGFPASALPRFPSGSGLSLTLCAPVSAGPSGGYKPGPVLPASASLALYLSLLSAPVWRRTRC